jgi:hypothetical protein
MRPELVDHAVAPNGNGRPPWTFLTNHLHVLACIYRDPHIRLRDVAAMVGITERAAQSMVADLAGAGYVTRVRVGTRNHYEVHRAVPLRHPLDAGLTIGVLLDALAGAAPAAASGQAHESLPVAEVG